MALHEENVGKLFNDWADTGRAERMAQGHAPLLEPLTQLWNFKAVDRLLDVGCGNGWALQFALDRGAKEIAGIDVADKMISAAQNNLPTGEFKKGSMQKLPWPDDHFSHILSVEAIYYAANPIAAFEEMQRVLQPNGQIAIILEYFQENKGSHVWKDSMGVGMQLWSEMEWLQAMRKAGFATIRAQRIHRDGLTPEEKFSPTPSFPSYEMYMDYTGAGALLLYN